ncbi:hypothetical protein KY284_022234 [Solanum tuberosum]|nr:hypothetical protein KY284_022234 [Solanum tuberosum]
MLTTRQRRVAEAVSTHPHNLEKLSKGDSFKLLEQRVFGKTRECPIKLRGYGNEIVDKCCGVPLVLVVIAGALRGCLGDSEWKLVKDNVGKHLLNKDDNKSSLKFVETSYNHLPQQRKAAFLYFGVFPQGFDIPAWKLILLWVAEGLIKSGLQGSKIEEVAETYLSDFAGRNLVMVMQKRSNGQIKTCRLHDMLHEFCIVEAERISLFQQVYLQPGVRVFPSIEDPSTSRQLCIQSSIPYNFIPKDRIVQHVRSLLCFSSDQKQIDLSNLDIQLIPYAFPLIRVLDIQSLIFEFSEMFYRLFHLRAIGSSSWKVYQGSGFDSFQELRCVENLKLLNNGWSEELHLPAQFFSLQKTLNKLTLSNTSFEWSEARYVGAVDWAENWEAWDASNRSFQSLTHLVLISCYDLNAVPHELADLPYLQEMRLMRTFKAVSSAREIKSKKLRRQDPESSINLIIFPPASSTN